MQKRNRANLVNSILWLNIVAILHVSKCVPLPAPSERFRLAHSRFNTFKLEGAMIIQGKNGHSTVGTSPVILFSSAPPDPACFTSLPFVFQFLAASVLIRSHSQLSQQCSLCLWPLPSHAFLCCSLHPVTQL